MKKWLKDNWFKVAVLLLLIMIYSRLGDIKENNFYTADVVDASATRVINQLYNLEDYLSDISDYTSEIGN